MNPKTVDHTLRLMHKDRLTGELTMNELEAVAEFREASAALRRACGVRDDARVAQILADTRMGEATLNLTDAQARLAAADMALQAARAEPPAPADIDASRQPVVNGLVINGDAFDPVQTDPFAIEL
jgi:hypothetical protein